MDQVKIVGQCTRFLRTELAFAEVELAVEESQSVEDDLQIKKALLERQREKIIVQVYEGISVAEAS